MNRPIPRVLSEYVAGLARHDIDKIAATVSDDLLFISATRILGKLQFLDMLNALYTGFPDWNYEYDEIEDRGLDNYAIKWRQGGTHSGTWSMPGMDPIAATGKRVRIQPQYFFYRIANEQLVLIFPEPVVGGAPRGIVEQICTDVLAL